VVPVCDGSNVAPEERSTVHRRAVPHVAALALAVLLGACSGGEGDVGLGVLPEITAPPAPTASAEPAEPVPPGGTVVLRDGADELAVTLLRIVDGAPPHPRSYRDDDVVGVRLVAAELVVANRGAAPSQVLDTATAVLVGAGDEEVAPAPVRTDACAELGPTVRLVAGDARSGCVTFEVPEGVAPVALRLRAGLAPSTPTARWDLTAPPVDEPVEVPVAAGSAVGQALSLVGSGGPGVGETDAEVEVVVAGVVDPAEGDVFGPLPGHRYVAVDLGVRNTGPVPYEHGRGSVALVAEGGASYRAALFLTPTCEVFVAGTVVEPAAEHRGCVLFEVPEGVVPAAFEFVVGAGATDPGRWLLR
jgi:hypothetical protein